MSDMAGPPPPAPQHALLQKAVGTWSVACTYFTPNGPMETEARETVEPVGAYWTRSSFKSTIMGMPFEGCATLGFDPFKQKFVGTWFDSMVPVIYPFEGDYDEPAGIVSMAGEGNMPQFGGFCAYRMQHTIQDDDHNTFEMWVTPPGGEEMQLFKYAYSRAD